MKMKRRENKNTALVVNDEISSSISEIEIEMNANANVSDERREMRENNLSMSIAVGMARRDERASDTFDVR